jgi:hypothetical protein
MRPDQLERRLRECLDALGPAARAELLHVLMLPDFERADRIGEFWGYPQSRAFAELLIDCEGTERSEPCWLGCCERATGTPRALDGRLDQVASTEMASCVPLEPRLLGFVHLRFDPCRAGSARSEG